MAALSARARVCACGLLLAAGSAQAEVLTYVESGGGTSSIALGYAVPRPLEGSAPAAGFRSYGALMARLQDLALASDDLRAQPVGQSVAGRRVVAYLAGDADALTPEGEPESAVLINGGIHAREWASPEVVAGLVEDLLRPEARPGLQRYLLDVQTVVALPVLNVDGLLQTQRYPDQTLRSEYAGDGRDTPRDGRMQRKNLRDQDEILCAAADPACAVADGMNGVDLNRNHAPYWGGDGAGSSQPQALTYRGIAPASEPETLALYAAQALAPAERLRLYVDVHSFGRQWLGVRTGNARRDALQESLGARLRTVAATPYRYSTLAASSGVGASDEHYATTLQVPAYTLELEPGPAGATEYGGFGNDHDGFILPASQIARVRSQMSRALQLALYCMAGPPSVQSVQLREAASGTVVFAGQWAGTGTGTRRFAVSTRQPLHAERDYRLRVSFDKPMRVRDSAGALAQFPGQNVRLAPRVTLEGHDAGGEVFALELPAEADAWLGADGAQRYADDAFELGLRLPASLPLARATRLNLAIESSDFCGQALDADPATAVDFADGAFTALEDSSGLAGDRGGIDRRVRLLDDGAPPFTAPAAAPGSGGGGGALGLVPLLLFGIATLFAGLRRARRAA